MKLHSYFQNGNDWKEISMEDEAKKELTDVELHWVREYIQLQIEKEKKMDAIRTAIIEKVAAGSVWALLLWAFNYFVENYRK